MATRLIGTDDANPRLPAVVVTATQGTTAADLAPGNIGATTTAAANAYTDAEVAESLTAANVYTDSKVATVTPASIGALTTATADPLYVNVTGDTLTGPLLLAANPSAALGAATKQYVDTTAAAQLDQAEASALHATRPHIYLPATTGNFISAPDPPQLAGATQLDIRWIEKAPANGAAGYTPGGVVIAQGSGAAAATSSFLVTNLSGQTYVNFFVSNGTTFAGPVQLQVRPTTGVAAARLTWRGSDGRVQMFTKATSDVAAMLDNSGWSQVGTNQTMAIAALADNAQPLTINGYGSGGTPTVISMLAASVATTIDGTPFACWRSDTQANPYLDDYSTPWTINGTAWEWRDANGLQIGGPQQDAMAATLYSTRPHIYLPATTGNFISAPDPPQLAGATQLDIRWIEKAPPNGAAGYLSNPLAIQGFTGSSFAFRVNGIAGTANSYFELTAPGTALMQANRPVAGVAAARVTWRASDGRAQAFTKPTADVAGMLDNTGWVQVGANVTLQTAPLINDTSMLTINAYGNATVPSTQNALAWSFATTIDGTPFACWRADPMARQYTDDYGTRWTLNGTAWEWRDANALQIGGPQPSDIITGTGNPEGVVIAPVGQRYIDTNATCGAIEWIKASGAGNTGWKVVYGDTGWRNMLGSITPITGVTPGICQLRRTNAVISWRWYWTTTAAPGGAAVVLAVPAGFRYYDGVSDSTWVAFNSAAVSAGSIYTVAGGSSLALRPVASGSAGFGFEYVTADYIWPATLPGTAA